MYDCIIMCYILMIVTFLTTSFGKLFWNPLKKGILDPCKVLYLLNFYLVLNFIYYLGTAGTSV